MLRAEIGTSVVVSGLLLVWIHMLALRFSWYWKFEWFDSPVHFVGGMMAAFMVAFIILLVDRTAEEAKQKYALFILFGTLAIGVLWEVFEHFFNISFDPVQSFDTALDLIMDVAGALTAIGAIHLFRVLQFKRKRLPQERRAVEGGIPETL